MNTSRKFLLTGSTGWFGRTAINEYKKLFGNNSLINDLVPFASNYKEIEVLNINKRIKVFPLKQIFEEKEPAGILHLAFLTRDKIQKYGTENYIKINRNITKIVSDYISLHPEIPIITISSGAANFIENKKDNIESNPYSFLKNEEELIFKKNSLNRMSIVFRVFAATGEYITEPERFALGEFLKCALNKQTIKIKSKRKVLRSYVNVETLMKLCWLILKNPLKEGFYNFDACFEDLSILELAKKISNEWDLNNPISEINEKTPPEVYCGDKKQFKSILKTYGIIHPNIQSQLKLTSKSLNLIK